VLQRLDCPRGEIGQIADGRAYDVESGFHWGEGRGWGKEGK
jgi:predicted heme/steroid binding protein